MNMKPINISKDAFRDAMTQLMGEVLDQIKGGERSAVYSDITANGNRIRLLVVKIQEDDNDLHSKI